MLAGGRLEAGKTICNRHDGETLASEDGLVEPPGRRVVINDEKLAAHATSLWR